MSSEEVKEYTLAEVAKKTGSDGQPIWIIIKDQVYDVTKFAYEHPGGADLVLECAGTDATKTFNDVGHSSDANSILKRLKAGQLVESERKYEKKKTVKPETSNAGGDAISKKSFVSMVTCGLCG